MFLRLSSRPSARLRVALCAVAFGCAVVTSGAASAQTHQWSRVGVVSSLTSGQMCKTDGTFVICDSTTPTISGSQVGIGTTAPNASALLDVFSTTQGLLPPRVTATQEAAIGTNSAMGGLVVYNTTANELDVYNSSTNAWEAVGANAADAAGSTGQVQFNLNSSNELGASANLFWDNTNNRLGIGTTSPTKTLHVNAGSTSGSGVEFDGLGSGGGSFSFLGSGTGEEIFFYSPGGSGSAPVISATGYNNTQLQLNAPDTTLGSIFLNAGGKSILYLYKGGVSIGTSYVGLNTPTNGLLVQGGVGIGTATISSSNTLEVKGAASIGYPDTYGGSAGGLIISGNVGIGTTSPTQLLSLNGAAGSPATSGTTQNGLFRITNSSNAVALDIGELAAPPYTTWIQNTQSSSLANNWPLALNPNGGNVGINTIAPQVKLDVTGSIATGSIGTEDEFHITRLANGGTAWPQIATFQLGSYAVNGSGNSYGPSTRLDINLKAAANATLTGDTNIMTLQSNGNVGIGTTAPDALLSLGGGAARVIDVVRNTTANTAGNGLTI